MNENFDFVIVGSGGGSMCAALVMRAAGKSVLILEKTDQVGGTTAISGGVMWIPDNQFMKKDGIRDSREHATAYLDAVVGDDDDTPGASRARRLAYVEQAPEMIDFLANQGIALRRMPSWPDYYEAPGESVPGRTVVSELFDINQLGEWKSRLRPGFLPLAAYLEEAMELPNFKRTWAAKKILARAIGRTLFSKLKGKHLATAGQALQGQMLHRSIKGGWRYESMPVLSSYWCRMGRLPVYLSTRTAPTGQLARAQEYSSTPAVLPATSACWTSTSPAHPPHGQKPPPAILAR